MSDIESTLDAISNLSDKEIAYIYDYLDANHIDAGLITEEIAENLLASLNDKFKEQGE